MSSSTLYGIMTMVYGILIHTRFGLLQSNVFKYHTAHYMSNTYDGKGPKKSRVQMSSGLHTAEQDFHFSNLRLFLPVDLFQLRVARHTLVLYRMSQNLCHKLFLGIPHPHLSKKVPINMGPKVNRFQDIDLRSCAGIEYYIRCLRC
jgi:hypothetical protein